MFFRGNFKNPDGAASVTDCNFFADPCPLAMCRLMFTEYKYKKAPSFLDQELISYRYSSCSKKSKNAEAALFQIGTG